MKTFEQTGWSLEAINYLNNFSCQGVEFWTSKIDDSKDVMLANFVDFIKKLDQRGHSILIAGTEAPQPNNRITRYKKLWGLLGISAENIPVEFITEWIVDFDLQIKFFGAIDFRFVSLESLYILWRHNYLCWIINSNVNDVKNMQMRLHVGWEFVNGKPSKNLIDLISLDDAILIRKFGLTNQMSSSVIAIGSIRGIDDLRQAST